MTMQEYKAIKQVKNQAYIYELLEDDKSFGVSIQSLDDSNKVCSVTNIMSSKEMIEKLFQMCYKYCVSCVELPYIVEDYYFDYEVKQNIHVI